MKRVCNRSAQITELLDTFDLTEHQNKKVRALSGGMRQRLSIALAFVGEPSLVILDEPTAGLDPLQRIRFKNYIAEKRAEKTIIISTHIVSDVEDLANNVIFLKKGQIVLSGTLHEITKNNNLTCWIVPSQNMLPSEMPYRLCGGTAKNFV